MKSETVTKLPLPDFARIMGINPLHFMGVQITEIQNATCDAAWFQYEWQNADQVSREEIAAAIRAAEDEIERYLNYRLLPSWEEEEWRNTARPYPRQNVYFGGGRDVRGFSSAVETRWKHVIAGGRREQTLVEADAAIAYASTNPPTTWLDTATVTVTVEDGVQACELAVYYPDKSGDERWRIRPVHASIVSNTATITFRRELAVAESVFESIASGGNYIRPASGTNDDHFLTTVDVYRVRNTAETQASLTWYPPTCGWCGGSGCGTCALAEQTACLTVRDPEMGFVAYQPATWDSDEAEFTAAAYAYGRAPDAVRLYYYSGLRDRERDCPLTEMHPDWARTVAILAASRLSRPLCECARGFASHWQRSVALNGDTSFQVSPEDLRNPFGTRVGEIYAWHRVTTPGVRIASSA